MANCSNSTWVNVAETFSCNRVSTIQANKFPGDFQTISRRHFNKTLTPEITLILFTRCTLSNFCWQLCSNANLWDQWSSLSSKRNYQHKNILSYHYHLPNNWTRANFLWLDDFDVVPSVKKFPGGPTKLNSRRFAGFPEVVDTLYLLVEIFYWARMY